MPAPDVRLSSPILDALPPLAPDAPVLLDLYSCAGGAAVGYRRAGWRVIGVDINAQPRYPFEHHVGDAIAFLKEHGHEFDAHHGSPPCQASTPTTSGSNAARYAAAGFEHVRLIADTRDALAAGGRPSVIENVRPWTRIGPELGVRPDLELCGDMFGLRVIRHRVFEFGGGVFAWQPEHTTSRRYHRGPVSGWRHRVWREGPYFQVHGDGGGKGTVAQWQGAMGIDWTDVRREIAEAIPPAYSEFIGRELLRAIGR